MVDEANLAAYFEVLRRRAGVIGLLVVTAVLSSAVLSLLFPKVYEAHSVFYVPGATDAVSLVSGDSPRTLVGRPPLPAADQQQARSLIGVLRGKDFTRAVNARFPGKSLDALQRDVDYAASREGLLHVYVRDRDPQLAAAIANAYPEILNDFMLRASVGRVTQDRSILEGQLGQMREQLQQLQESRRRFQEEHKLSSSLEGELDAQTSSRSQFQVELDSAEVRLREIQENVRSTQRQMAEEAKVYSRVRDSLYESLRQNLVKLKVEGETQQTRIRALEDVMAGIERRAQEMPKIMEEASRTEQEIERLQELLATMERNLEELKSQQMRRQQVGVVVETAEPPLRPVFPILWLNALVSVALGLLAGVAYAFFLDYLEEEARERRFRAVQLLGALQSKPSEV